MEEGVIKEEPVYIPLGITSTNMGVATVTLPQ